LAAVALPKLQSMDIDAKKAVVQGGLAAVQSSAVISFAKSKGASTFANISGNTILDTNIKNLVTNNATPTICNAVAVDTVITADYNGEAGTSASATIPAGLCVN
jgi:hypothetical protein